MKRMTDPATGAVSSRTLGGIRIKLWTDEDAGVVTDGYQWNASEGRFFEDQYSDTELADTDDRRLRTIWWEPPPNANRDWVVSLSVTVNRLDGGTETLYDQTTFKSRVLEVQTPIMEGDDVAMLQSALRGLGFSTVDTYPNWGVGGPAPKVDGQFGLGSRTAVHACQVADRLTKTSKVDDATVAALEENWADYVDAYQRFDSSPTITVNDGRMDRWITEAVNPTSSEPLLLKYSYNDALHNQAAPGVAYNDLIKAWIVEEADLYGQWGYAIPFRTTVGAADDVGSIGFSQIQAKYRFGKPQTQPKRWLEGERLPELEGLDLYDPVGAIKAMGVFSNIRYNPYLGVPNPPSGGFFRAFRNGFFKKTLPKAQYPHVTANVPDGSKYEDTPKDLLTKALGSYNGGVNRAVYKTHAWPDSLRQEANYPNANISMRYALEIEMRAGVPLKTWTWIDQAINAGPDGVCQTPGLQLFDDVFVGSPGPLPNQICVISSSGGPPGIIPAGDDEYVEFSFDYGENQWMSGKSWNEERLKLFTTGP